MVILLALMVVLVLAVNFVYRAYRENAATRRAERDFLRLHHQVSPFKDDSRDDAP
ncbi:MAG: hypothetical protein ACP5FH_06595 [Terracidiphilus sp.]